MTCLTNQCVCRYLSSMFRYLLEEELDLFKAVLISKLVWHTLNLHGDEESERKWWPLGCLFVCLFLGLAFWNINILISVQVSFLYSRASWKKRVFYLGRLSSFFFLSLRLTELALPLPFFVLLIAARVI